MGTKGTTGYPTGDQNALHCITIATVVWIGIFTRLLFKDIFIESLRYCRTNKGPKIFAMSSELW
jgi:putative transposase